MKIFAVGMNYAQHTKELDGKEYKPETPVIFLKPDSSLLKPGKPFFVPDHLGRIDYEAELVVRICRLGKNIPQRFAHRYYDAVTVGIDFTARDLQRQARQAGMPWTLCKGFDGAAVIGEWVPLNMEHGTLRSSLLASPAKNVPLGDVRRRFACEERLHFHLDINGQTVQEGCSADMLYGVDELIAYISQFFTLKTGDLLYTGTPAGVGPVNIGDRLEGWIEDQQVLKLNCR